MGEKLFIGEIKREMEFQDISVIKGYHAHVYFDESTPTKNLNKAAHNLYFG